MGCDENGDPACEDVNSRAGLRGEHQPEVGQELLPHEVVQLDPAAADLPLVVRVVPAGEGSQLVREPLVLLVRVVVHHLLQHGYVAETVDTHGCQGPDPVLLRETPYASQDGRFPPAAPLQRAVSIVAVIAVVPVIIVWRLYTGLVRNFDMIMRKQTGT